MAYGYFTKIVVLTGAFCAFFCGSAGATIIDFDSPGPPGMFGMNIGPGLSYTEAGYTFSGTTASSAIIAKDDYFAGNTTNSLTFSETTVITITGPAPFNLDSLYVVNAAFDFNPLINLIVTGYAADNSIVGVRTVTGLTKTPPVTAVLGLQNISYATFMAVRPDPNVFPAPANAAFDDLVVTTAAATPEPSSLFMFGLGLAALAIAGNYSRLHRR